MKNSFMKNNPDKWKDYITEWRIKNKDKIKDYQKKNKAKLKAYHTEWKAKNRVKVKEKQAEWYKNNTEKAKLNSQRYIKEHADRVNKRRAKWRAKHPDRVKAQYTLQRLVEREVIKPTKCFVCGAIKTEAHHPDYSKPTEVVWLCRTHHVLADAERRLLEKTQTDRIAKT